MFLFFVLQESRLLFSWSLDFSSWVCERTFSIFASVNSKCTEIFVINCVECFPFNFLIRC